VKNVLDNAIKYSAPESPISVRVWSEADDAFLVVQDYGIGIAREQIPRVFDPYMQVDAALPYARGSLGLGLSLVRGIVEAHGGTIRLASDGVAKRTRVGIRLPLMA
jgi:signal transduction histidine kinase